MGANGEVDSSSVLKMPQSKDALRQLIAQWNANRLDLFEISEPNEDGEFQGVMRFYFQEAGAKVATKCVRISSTATTKAVIETLVEKFRPDMRMLSIPQYALYEIHENGEERRLGDQERPLFVQLNWHSDDREGRFLLKRIDEQTNTVKDVPANETFKRKLSKREKKQLKKLQEKNKTDSASAAEKLYTELPETSFTRSISNPEAVMRRRRQQKLEKKLAQFRSRDGGPDTGGTLKIYGQSLCEDVPYKTLLLSVNDTAVYVVKEMLVKYALTNQEPQNFCLVQVCDGEGEYILDDDESPLSILMNQPNDRGSIMFHVRRRPPDYHPRKRKKKPGRRAEEEGLSGYRGSYDGQLEPLLIELFPDGSETGRRIALESDVTEVGSDWGGLQLAGLRPRHCVIANTEGIVTLTPSSRDSDIYINGQRIYETTMLQHGAIIRFGRTHYFRFSQRGGPNAGRSFSEREVIESPTMTGEGMTTLTGGSIAQSPPMSPSQDDVPRAIRPDSILPATLELPEAGEEPFLSLVVVNVSPATLQFKLSPTYAIYLAARYRATTHFRPDATPHERAHMLSAFLVRIAHLMMQTVQDRNSDANSLAFWMANSSELLHFLKSDKQIGAFSLDAQDVLAEVVQLSFRHLVTCIQGELSNLIGHFFLERDDDDENATAPMLGVLGSAMTLLRRSRVNAALTIQLFSQVFHFINMSVFNKLIGMDGRNYCSRLWGNRLRRRLNRIETWAEKQGLELAADCHLVRVIQATHLLQGPKSTPDEVASVASSCFKLNSLQLRCLLMKYQYEADEIPIAPEILENVVRVAESTVDDVIRADGRHIKVEEEPLLGLAFLLPEDGYSCDIVRGIPTGIVEFLSPLSPVCRLTPNPAAAGYWTIFFQDPMRSPSAMSFAAAFNNVSGSGHVPPPQTPGSVMSDRHSLMSHNLSNINMSMSMSSTSMGGPNQNLISGGSGFSSNHLMPPNPHPVRQFEPEIQTIKLHKISGGLGLSIVAAKATGQEKLGIYIKSVVQNGSAALDGRLSAGDQLISVDGQSLIGISQEEAAKYLVRTGPVVTLEVGKQAALFQGLASMLNQPSPDISRGKGDGADLHILDDGDDEASTDEDIELDINDVALLMNADHDFKSNTHRIGKSIACRKQETLRCINTEPLSFCQKINTATNSKAPFLINSNAIDGGNDLVDSSYWSSAYSGSGGGGGFMGPPPGMLNGYGFFNIRPSQSDSCLARWNSFEALNRKGLSESALGVTRIVGPSRLLKLLTNPDFFYPYTANNSSSDNSPSGFNASRRMSERDLPSKVEFTDPSNLAHLPPGHPLLQPRIQSSKSVPSLNSDHPGPGLHSHSTTVVPPMVRSPGHQNSVSHGQHDMSNNSRYAQHYPSASMTMQHSSKVSSIGGPSHVQSINNMEMQHPRSRSIQSLTDPPYRPDIGNKQPSTPSLHTHQNEEPERFYQNVGFYPPPPPPPSNPANMPVRTYIPYSNSTGNISSSAGFRSPGGGHQGVQQYPGPGYPPPRQAPPNLNTSMPGNLNWSRTNPVQNPGVNRDLLRQEAKMLEMQDELRRREERAAIMMSKAQQNYPQRYAPTQSRMVYPGGHPGHRQLSGTAPTPAPKPYRPGDLDIPPGRPPLPEEYKHQTQFSASMGEIPKGAFSYNNGIMPKSPSVPGNPWDREEKELEAGRKKEAAKYWRDQHIHDLETMPHRTPSQDEQMRALKLEREFQRRAEEIKKDDDGEYEEEEEEQDERKAMIRRLQEDLERTKITSNGNKLDPMEEERARKIEEIRRKKLELEAAQAAEERLVREATKRREEELRRQMQQHSFPYQSPYRTSYPPKLSSPNSSTTVPTENHHLSPTGVAAPPLPKSPPPSLYRGHQQAASSPEKTSVSPPQTSPRPRSDKKTVSFNETVATNEPPASPEHMLPAENVREDPNKFFTEATAMLQSPRSPEVVTPGGTGSTPGVIGAQEVYRDPRMRRLAEQQQKQQAGSTPKPEKLTFKEKMKMFAMEVGEAETPKDKVKTSKAQREIETTPTSAAGKQ